MKRAFQALPTVNSERPLKLYQMDVAHAILFAKTIDISRVTADYLSAKFE